MEQSTLSDSTRMPAAQVETRDHAQEARVAAMLTAPADPARPLVAKIFRALEEAERVWAPVAALYDAADAEATAAGITIGRAEEAGLPTWRAYSAAWKQAQPGMEEFCASVAPLMKRPARTLDDLMLKHRISLTLEEYEGEAVADLDRLAKSWSPAPRAPTPPFSAAAEVSLAYMVVDYFGSEDIHPALNCDIALRDRARAIVAAAAEPDPIFAAIEKDRALAAEHIRLLGISGSKPDEDPSWEPTHDASDALWAHWDDAMLKTVPTTPAGCVALARYANEWSEREGLDLSEAGPKIFDLIGRSPLLTAPATQLAYPDPIFVALDACRAPEAEREKFHAIHSVGKTGPGYTFEREMALDDAVDAAFDAVFATMPTTRAGRLALTAFIKRRIAWSACPDGSPQEGEDTVFADAYRALARVIEADVPEVAEDGIAEALHRAVDLKALDIKDLSHLALWTESLITMASGLAQRGGRRPLGRFFDRISNALCNVVVEAQDELRASSPADALEREYRAKTIALPVIENGDVAELESLIADLQIEVAYLRQPMTAEVAR